MASHGGARNRSGPQPDPNSLNSANKGRTFRTLPAEGYEGDIPDFPLLDASERELAIWGEAWRTPQAVAWAEEPWRHRTVALWVRWSVRVEDPDASASLVAQVIRFADQIGMTPAGLKENGWAVGQVAASSGPTRRRSSVRDRLTVVPGGGG